MNGYGGRFFNRHKSLIPTHINFHISGFWGFGVLGFWGLGFRV